MSAPLGKIARNATSMLASDVVNRATTFVIYALVARYLGAHSVGQLALAMTLFYTFNIFAITGVNMLAAREVAKDKSMTSHYLIGGSLLVVATSAICVAILFGLVRLVNYEADTATAICVLSLALFPAALSMVAESVIWAWERMHLIAVANLPVGAAKVVVCYLLLAHGSGLYEVVVALVFCRIALLMFEWGLLLAFVCRPRLAVAPQLFTTMVRQAVPFLGIDAMVTVQPAVIAVLLSKLVSESAVGLYVAGAQLLVPVTLVFNNVMISVFPVLCRTFTAGFDKARTVAAYLLESLLIFAVPGATGLYLLSEPILLLIYGKEDFVAAAPVLRIIVWGLVLGVYSHALGNILIAGRREKVNLWIVVVDVTTSLALGGLLIWRFGLLGAPVTVVVVRVIDCVLHYICASRLLPQIPVISVLWKPVLASAVMAVCLLAAQLPGVVEPILLGVVTYTGVLSVLFIWSYGGVRPFAARYFAAQLEDTAKEAL